MSGAPRALAAPVRAVATLTRPVRAWSRLARTARRALVVLVLVPMLLDLPFSLAGHPLAQGDNLTQNYPLRVLTGEILRGGHLPVWDPLIWSGTPLLAGWNAGSMFPATWLFAVLPQIAAWTIDQMVAPMLAGLGAYVLLRRLSCGALGAFFGAAAFTWTGFMSGQAVHIGLVQGASMLPWSLLALELLYARRIEDAPVRAYLLPVVLLAVSSALTLLAGDPRAVSSAAVVLALYLVALCWRARRKAPGLAAASIGGIGLGALCCALQWRPGLGFLKASQRGSTAYAFFGAGSLTFKHLLAFTLLPFADGGNGNFGQPTYAGGYNLPELTIGVGLLALVAASALLPELVAGLMGRARGRGSPEQATRPLGVWYVLIVIGVLLTLGTTTPLGHVLVDIPLFGGERLQNRNAEIYDLALCILLAFFTDDLSQPNLRRIDAPRTLERASARMLGLLPLLGALGLGCYVVAFPASAQRQFGNATIDPALPGLLVPYLIWELAVVVLAMLIIVARTKLSHPLRRNLLVLALVADIGCFVFNQDYATSPSFVLGGANPTSATLATLVGASGRYALYDPLSENPSANPNALSELGASDLNIVQHTPSVQGYGSIVSSFYDTATATHRYGNLKAAALSGSVFDALDLSTLVTTDAYLYQVLPPSTNAPVRDPNAPSRENPRLASLSSGPWTLKPGQVLVLQVGNPTTVASVQVTARPAPGTARPCVAIGAATSGKALQTIALRHGRARLRLGHPHATTSITLANPMRHDLTVASVIATTRNPAARLLLNGHLQGLIEPPHWRWLAAIGPFVVYRNTKTAGFAWLQPKGLSEPFPSRRLPAKITTHLSAGQAPDAMTVHASQPAVLVRSQTFEPGWSARITPLQGGPTHVVAVRRLGVVQAIDIPAGTYRVTWRYAPVTLLEGLVLSAVGTVVTLGLAALAFGARRHTRVGGKGTPQAT